MTLNNYILNGPSVVILDDKRNPDTSWANHLERTGRGGVDLVAAVGTPVYAPTDGWMDWRPNDGSAGNSSRFRHEHNPGWKDVFSHLSLYNGRNGQYFHKGDLIAWTGNSGNVTQHLHRHLLDPSDNRQNPWHYFSASSPAGPGGTPITSKGPRNMYLFRTVDGTIFLVTSNGFAAISTPAHVDLFTRMFNSYPGTDTFNAAERDIVRSYIHAASTADDAEHATLLAALANIKLTVDPTIIANAITAAIKATGVKVDTAVIVSAVDAALKDDFAAIPGAVRSAIIK